MPASVSSTSGGTSSPGDASQAAYTPGTSASLMDEHLCPLMTGSESVVVGMACRLPGAKNPQQLWKNIIDQRDLQTKIPKDRFNIDAYYHPDGTHKGTMNAQYGYFLDDDIRKFDPEFFQISGKEAEAMDPQQRMLLEVVYEALENAGITLQEISGTNTSVYCGCFTNDYREMTYKDIECYPKYCATGTGMAILSNRISYFYNLHGPSVTIDTACSSSLVGLHMGNSSIRDGESDISIIVGSALHFDPTIFTTMTDLGFLSTDGRCRAFDADGKGYVRGEGICAVILKNKSKALYDGDSIRALVRGTACNHDGAKEGITMPNSAAQEALIRTIYKNAGLSTHETTYFEAHGTGTQAGDPRETRAIGSVFAPNRDRPLYVGSIKTNIGHLEGASGLAGIMKTVMSLEAETILPNMHFKTPNPNIDFKAWKISIPTTAIPWESVNGIRRASVNSFGYGGTNAHVILEQYVEPHSNAQLTSIPAAFEAMTLNRPMLLPLSSHTEKAGKVLRTTLRTLNEEAPETTTADLAFSLSSTRRTQHRYRSYAISTNATTLEKTFEGDGVPWKPVLNRKPRIGFVFTGQGAQWYAMGRELFHKSPMFRQLLIKCEGIMKTLENPPTWSIIEELSRSKEETNVNNIAYGVALSPSIQVCVVELLKAWGITPSAVCGHSAGEIAASYAAGIISFEDAIVCAWYRGTVFTHYDPPDKVKVPGAMIAVGISEAEAEVELEKYNGKLCIAAINSPSSLTISGDMPECLEFKKSLDERKIFVRRLAIPQAYHSHHMIPHVSELLRLTKRVKGSPANCRMFSSVTGRLIKGEEIGGSYFCDNLVSAVRFSDALTGTVLNESEEQIVDVLIEIGAHPALKGPARQTLQSLKIDLPYYGTITRDKPDFSCLLECAGQLYALGYPVNLEAVNSNLFLDQNGSLRQVPAGQIVKLPSYSWDHGKYWFETRYVKNYRKRKERHAFLGAQTYGDVDKHPRWRVFLRPSELPWLTHHMIDGKTIFPAAGYLSMAVEAAIRFEDSPENFESVTIQDMNIKSALTVSDSEMGTEAILEMQPLPVSAKRVSDTQSRFTISSYSDSGVVSEHCSGVVSVQKGEAKVIECDELARSFAELQKLTNKTTCVKKSYQFWQDIGLGYGQSFQLLNGNVDSGSGVAMSQILLNSKDQELDDYEHSIIHPTFLDASFHPFFASIESLTGHPLDAPWVPTFIKSIKVSGAFAAQSASNQEHKLWTTTETALPGPRTAVINVKVRSADGQNTLVDVKGLEATALGGSGAEDDQYRSLFFRTRWQPLFAMLDGTEELSQTKNIGNLVDVFAHERPDSKILHITPSLDATKGVLSSLFRGQRRRFATLTIAACSDIEVEALENFESEYSSLVNHAEPASNTYDLVVVSGAPNMDVKVLLCPGGYVIADTAEYTGQGLDRLFENDTLTVWASKSDETKDETDLTIVMSETPSDRTRALCSKFEEQQQGPVQKVALAEVVGSSIDSSRILVLASLDEDLLLKHDDREASRFEAVRSLMTMSNKSVVWVLYGSTMESSNPAQALINGMARSARNENDSLKLVTLDVGEDANTAAIATAVHQVFNSPMTEDEVVMRHGTLFIPRIEADDELNSKLPKNASNEAKREPLGQTKPLSLKIGKVGLLETLAFSLDEEISDTQLAGNEIEIEVKASTINFRDVAASMGIIDDYRLGDECAGVVLRIGEQVPPNNFNIGDHVVAFRPGQGAHRTMVRNHWTQCHKFNGISFAHAAALPLVTTTAYYALIDLARLQQGETVLIHAAAGGVGQMAIQLAQMLGAEVIATCGSQTKRDLLKSAYGLNDDHIFSSRNPSFAKDVMKLTGGKGVNVVLNSLAGELLHATWNCIARFGRFIEIGKRDIHENAKIEMSPFRKNVLFASADLITIWEHDKPLSQRLLQDAFRLLEAGKIKNPETVIQLPYSEVERGFRLLQMGKHTGKVVLVPHKDDLVAVSQPIYRQKDLFRPEKTYLLVGGLGGLGRTLSQWMVRKGARRLAFMSRSGESRPEAQATVSWLRARDIEVSVFAVDVTSMEQVQACIESLGDTLAGIFHAAVVLQDAPLDSMTAKQWRACLDPKVQGAWNLHQSTLKSGLDFFVTFSSLSCQLGGAGQANYSAANAFLDALMRNRRHAGLRGTTMNVGAISGAGLVAENEALMRFLTFMGYDMVNEEELLYQIEEAVAQSHASVSDERGIDMVGTITGVNMKKKDYYWHTRSFFRNLYSNHDLDRSASSGAKDSKSLSAQLKAATTLEERTAVLTAAFLEKTAAVLGADVATIQSTNPLSMYGLDSIVAVEFRKWFSKTVSVDIALFDILSSPSIDALVSKAASLMVIVDDAAPKTEAPQSKTSNTSAQPTVGAASLTAPSVLNKIALQRPEHLPMSNSQRRLWFAHQMAADKSALNIGIAAYMKGTPDYRIFKNAMDEWKRRNEMTRTLYFEGDDFPEQQSIEDFDSRLTYEDISSEEDSDDAVNKLVKRLRDEPMDIENGEAFRGVLVKLGDDYFAFVSAWHHIAIDRGSSKNSFEQIVGIYDALRLEKDLATVPMPSMSYIDFALWNEQYLQSDAIQAEAKFWLKKLHGINPQTKLLPFAKEPRSEVLDLSRKTIMLTLPLKMLNRLKRVSSRMAATPFHFLLAAFRAFWYRYTDEKDLTVLIIDGNRPRSDLDDVMGFYVNMIPVRINSDLEDGFDQLLKTTKKASVEAIEHSNMPFDAIVEKLHFPRNSSTFPISQIAMNYQMHGTMPRFVTKDFEINRVVNYDIPSACEIAIEALEDPGRGMDLSLQYSTRLYSDADMERFWDNFMTFTTSLIQDHMQPIDQVKIAGFKEVEYLKNDFWNMETIKNNWESVSVLDRIYTMAKKSPTSIAIQTPDDFLSYEALAEQAQRVAASLNQINVPSSTSVGILARPGIQAIVAMVGALSHGCGYLAMDPEFAAQRLAFMASDSAISALLVGDDLEAFALQVVAETTSDVKVMDIEHARTGKEMSWYANASLDDPFYTIYTSGSTGKPKGVVLTYANTHQMLATLHNDYAFTAADRFLHQSSMCFDLSIVQIFSALTTGATVCVATADARKDPSMLASFMQQAAVSVTYFTPTHFSLLLDASFDVLKQCKDYRVAFFAGERLPTRLVNRFCTLQIPATILNTWSPSELVVQTTIAKVTGTQSEQISIPIGYPMANCRHYIVDPQMNALPFGFIGEICVGGAQVGAGYLNRPDANAASFLEDPFCSEADRQRGWHRLFRTGDQGKFLLDGQLEFHGRIAGDKQIKLRGFRVDLGEVEHRIYVEASDISSAQLIDVALVARELNSTQGEADDRQVIAFLVLKQPLEPTVRALFVTDLHQRIGKHLNSYMLPNCYEFLDHMPLTIGRKVDRQNLLQRDLHPVMPGAAQRQESNNPSVPEAQQKILDVIIKQFHETLRLPADRTVTAYDSFFDIGGQSMLFLQLHAKLKRKLGSIPSIPELFKAPTPFLMSQIISNKSLTSSTGSNMLADKISHVNWAKEAMLPEDVRYMPGNVSSVQNSSEITGILITGLESFVGLHIFAALLTSRPKTTFYVLGEEKPGELKTLVEGLRSFKLLNTRLTEEMLLASVQFVQGALMRPQFGLAHAAFKALGNSIEAIYHLGGRVSLLKNYADLKRANVNTVLDLIELASYGKVQISINALSTWSVPHLQSHRKAKLFSTHFDRSETSTADYQPSDDAELFYFKSRWVAERLLTRAAERGFDVSIFRATAISGNTTTHVPPPQEDLVKQMIAEMINSATVPDFRSGAHSNPDMPSFVVDFVPVDYVANVIVDISTSQALRTQKQATQVKQDVSIYHICNPSALPLEQLKVLLPQIRKDGKGGELKSLDAWLVLMQQRAVSDAQKLTVEAAKAICDTGHIMFALESGRTREALRVARKGAGNAGDAEGTECPAIDVEFLRGLAGQ